MPRRGVLLEIVDLCDGVPTDHVVLVGDAGWHDPAALGARVQTEAVTALNGSGLLLLAA